VRCPPAELARLMASLVTLRAHGSRRTAGPDPDPVRRGRLQFLAPRRSPTFSWRSGVHLRSGGTALPCEPAASSRPYARARSSVRGLCSPAPRCMPAAHPHRR